ncbi:MAG: hypothetical protein QGG25_14690 [Phycisphaerae bacterium]|jgi:hypothetical protein|nr:hypothetical protein [Phycisphaerae bacterium]
MPEAGPWHVLSHWLETFLYGRCTDRIPAGGRHDGVNPIRLVRNSKQAIIILKKPHGLRIQSHIYLALAWSFMGGIRPAGKFCQIRPELYFFASKFKLDDGLNILVATDNKIRFALS